MKQKTMSLLISAGVWPHYRGFVYFLEAVRLASEDPERIQLMQTDIYQPIADSAGVTCESVEKNIRTIRDVFMKNGGGKILTDMTGSSIWEHTKPYPRELIALFALYTEQ